MKQLRGAVLLDPPTLPNRPMGPPIMDPSPHRNRGMPKAPPVSPAMLNRCIAMCVQFGMPRREAEEARRNPYVRVHILMLAGMIMEAARGDTACIAALERIRFAFGNARNVAETLAAIEQPADGGELQQLLGGD